MAFRDNIIRLKLSTRLNYHENVSHIKIDYEHMIEDMEGISEVEITNRADIEKIINYLNSLVLIEDNPAEYEDIDLYEVGYFEIFINRDKNENGPEDYDIIAFQTNYLAFIPGGSDCEEIRYYIKNSGYNPKTKSSKTFEFLYDLINANKD